MTRPDQLRQALAAYEVEDADADDETLVLDAARFALRVWEGDEQLVEKVADVIWRQNWKEPPSHTARAVLAAISEEDEK